MVERHPLLDLFTHLLLILGVFFVCFPILHRFCCIYTSSPRFINLPIPVIPGTQGVFIYKDILIHGLSATGNTPIAPMLWNSFLMAFLIATGKIVISILLLLLLYFSDFLCGMFVFG